MKNRESYLDTVRLIAILLVYIGHFTAHFRPDYLAYWSVPPTAWFLRYITGKKGVEILGVLLGFFAYRSKEKNTSKYILKRYFFFVWTGFFINCIYAVAAQFGYLAAPCTFLDVLRVSLRIGSDIFPTFWCMLPFFFGSVIAYLNGRAGVTYVGIACEIALFLLIDQVWIAICLIGCVVSLLREDARVAKAMSYLPVRLGLLFMGLLLINGQESNRFYLWDTCMVALVILVLMESDRLKKLLGFRPTASLGRNLTAMYLIHVAVYTIFGGWLFAVLPSPGSLGTFWLVFFLCLAAILLLGYPVDWLLQTVNRGFGRGVERVYSALVRGTGE